MNCRKERGGRREPAESGLVLEGGGAGSTARGPGCVRGRPPKRRPVPARTRAPAPAHRARFTNLAGTGHGARGCASHHPGGSLPPTLQPLLGSPCMRRPGKNNKSILL